MEGLTVSQQLDRTLDDVGKTMRGLREQIKSIPVRRAGFKKTHDEFARAMARLTVALEDASTS
jgi:hypothetical protein